MPTIQPSLFPSLPTDTPTNTAKKVLPIEWSFPYIMYMKSKTYLMAF